MLAAYNTNAAHSAAAPIKSAGRGQEVAGQSSQATTCRGVRNLQKGCSQTAACHLFIAVAGAAPLELRCCDLSPRLQVSGRDNSVVPAQTRRDRGRVDVAVVVVVVVIVIVVIVSVIYTPQIKETLLNSL